MENEELKNQTPEQTPEQEPQKPQKKKGFIARHVKNAVLAEILSWVVSLLAALLIVFVLKNFLFTLIRVDGHSMDPTLNDGERLFVTALDVRISGADRGDVVICHYPGRTNGLLGFEWMPIKEKTNFVKRVMAKEGDTYWRENNITFVTYADEADAQMMAERGLATFVEGSTVALDAEYMYRNTGTSQPDPNNKRTLDQDEYLVVGDNRGNSHDSRFIEVGPITKDMLVGKVRCVFWPLKNIRGVN